MNERITENYVRDNLKKLGYYDNKNLVVEEQISKHPQIKRLLKNASKSGEGYGRPEFIIRPCQGVDTVILIECKADKAKHQSSTLKNAKDYAIDGVLRYAKCLSKQYQVIAIAVSGETNPLISTYLCIGDTIQNLNIEALQSWNDLLYHIHFNPEVIKETEQRLIKFSSRLHNYIRDYLKLAENQKPLLVGACLVALQNKDYINGVDIELPVKQQLSKIRTAIESELDKAKINEDKIKTILQPLDNMFNEKSLKTEDNGLPAFNQMLDMLYRHVKPLLKVYKNFDILGHFYQEFLSYTAGDKKALGIVLTPNHITDLFTDLVNINTNSIVLDNCTGTGGFLIASMAKMVEQAKGDQELIKSIKSKQLVGVELQSNMFALACLNMMLKGDGKANLFNGSCFSLKETAQKRKPTAGMLNPPYSQKAEGLSELHFIENNLDCLQQGSSCAAIVPLSVAISGNNIHRAEIMKKHTLVACMTMPPDLFVNVGVHSCIMVWQAGIPHNSNKPSWFALWKDDGFVKTKTNGRCDYYNKWQAIKKQWLADYFGMTQKPGYATQQCVGPEDEWCAEAYLEPDYSNLTRASYLKTIKNQIMKEIEKEVDGVLL